MSSIFDSLPEPPKHEHIVDFSKEHIEEQVKKYEEEHLTPEEEEQFRMEREAGLHPGHR